MLVVLLLVLVVVLVVLVALLLYLIMIAKLQRVSVLLHRLLLQGLFKPRSIKHCLLSLTSAG